MNASQGLADKSVLVTGGAKRIGAAICRDLAAAGAHVIIHARNSVKAAEALAEEIGGSIVVADLAKSNATAGLFAAAQAAAEAPIDYVVHNASAFLAKSLADTTVEDWESMQHLHAWAGLVLARDLAGAGGSAMVNLLDTRISSHDSQHFAYLASKQTLAELTRSLAKELAPLRINGVAPGPILSPNDGTGTDMKSAIDATVLGRAGTPGELAAAVRFLLQAEYITGQVLHVDGGRHLRT